MVGAGGTAPPSRPYQDRVITMSTTRHRNWWKYRESNPTSPLGRRVYSALDIPLSKYFRFGSPGWNLTNIRGFKARCPNVGRQGNETVPIRLSKNFILSLAGVPGNDPGLATLEIAVLPVTLYPCKISSKTKTPKLSASGFDGQSCRPASNPEARWCNIPLRLLNSRQLARLGLLHRERHSFCLRKDVLPT